MVRSLARGGRDRASRRRAQTRFGSPGLSTSIAPAAEPRRGIPGASVLPTSQRDGRPTRTSSATAGGWACRQASTPAHVHSQRAAPVRTSVAVHAQLPARSWRTLRACPPLTAWTSFAALQYFVHASNCCASASIRRYAGRRGHRARVLDDLLHRAPGREVFQATGRAPTLTLTSSRLLHALDRARAGDEVMRSSTWPRSCRDSPSPAASRARRRLHQRGFVERREDEHDRRMKRVAITAGRPRGAVAASTPRGSPPRSSSPPR